MKRASNSRRDFLISSIQTLGAIGLGSNAIGMLLGSVYKKAFAETSGVNLGLNAEGFRYIYVSLSLAPPRWMFDMLPTPNGTSDAFVNGGFGNALNISGSNIEVVNQTYEYNYGGKNKLYLPPVWGMGLADANFSDLLPHTLFIRGMDMEINNHSLSNARQVAPILGGNSLHGVIADHMGSPVASVVNGAPSGAAFKSAKGLGAVTAGGTGNPITALIAPFKNLSGAVIYRAEEVKPVVDQFLDRMDSYAELHRISKSTLREAHDSADQLIRLNIDTLASSWEGVVAKYTDLVNTATHPIKGQLPGVFDKVVPKQASADPRFRFNNNSETLLVDLADARDMIQANTNKTEIARQFALTEILMTSGICSVVDLSPAITVLNKAKISATGVADITADQHGVGAVTSVIATTVFYRGLLTAVTELVHTLKQKALFDKTIIHISSEFNRIPRADGSGSDHGVGGGSATLMSGLFNEVAFIGNIKKGSETGNNPGTWGLAADWEFEDGSKRPIKVNDIARSITAMTNSSDIVANGYSLVKPTGTGLWIPKKAGGSNVA